MGFLGEKGGRRTALTGERRRGGLNEAHVAKEGRDDGKAGRGVVGVAEEGPQMLTGVCGAGLHEGGGA